MSNLNVTANLFLRNLYGNDRNMVNKSERKIVTNTSLTKADSKALGKGISSLSDYDYDSEDVDEKDFSNTLKAFADVYNSTLDSSSESSDATTKSLIKKFKQLQNDHGDELSKFGISFDDKGYMSISSSAVDNIKVSSFKEVFGKDTDFMSDLSALQKKLNRHVNYLA